MKKAKKIISIFLSFIIAAGFLTGCTAENEKIFQSKEDFAQAKIGDLYGSNQDFTSIKGL